MTIEAELPDGRVLEFPDGTSQDVIQASVKKVLAPAGPKTLWETVKEQASPDIFKAGEAAYNLGGKVTDATGSPELGGLTNLAGNVVPMLLGGIGGKGAEVVGKGTGRWLMQSAIKPTVGDLEAGKAARAIEFMLKEGRSPTEGGIHALRQEGAAIANEVKNVIAQSQARIPTNSTEKAMYDLAVKLESGTLGPEKSNEVLNILSKFLNHPSVRNRRSMSVQDAQAMKQANYKELDDVAYGLGVKTGTEKNAIKDITSTLKTEIEKAAPEVIPFNKRASDIWNAVNVAERRALLEGNKNPVNFGMALGGAAHNPGLTLGMWLNSSAAGKSLLARGVFSTAELGVPLGVLAGGVLSQSQRPE